MLPLERRELVYQYLDEVKVWVLRIYLLVPAVARPVRESHPHG